MSTTMFSWAGEGGESVRLREGKYAMRPVDKFVEVAAEIPRGRAVRDVVQEEVFWRAGDNLPINCPPPQWPVLVQVPSVFQKGEMVARHLKPKEACQLLDIPGVWPEDLIRNIWTWNKGVPLPLRFQVEFLLRGSSWLSSAVFDHNDNMSDPEFPNDEVSGLVLQTKAHMKIGETGLYLGSLIFGGCGNLKLLLGPNWRMSLTPSSNGLTDGERDKKYW
jgi:hypothetical protein